MSNQTFPWDFDVTFQETNSIRASQPPRDVSVNRAAPLLRRINSNQTFPWTFGIAFRETNSIRAKQQIRTINQTRQSITVTGTEIGTIQIPLRSCEILRQTTVVTGIGTATATEPLRRLSFSRFKTNFGLTNWFIDVKDIPTTPDETATDTALSLVFRVETDTLENVLRPLKDDEGKVDIRRTDDGGFTAIDRADGENTFDVIPPVNRLPLRQRSDYHVESYEESLVSQTVDEWDVELELLRTANRTDSPSINETRATDEWAFDTRYGQIATERVDAEFVGRGEGGVRRFEITARLTKEQSHVFEAALNRLGGARIRDIPDATNVAVDDTNDDAATLGVTSPVSDTIVSDGDYVVQEWQSRRLNDGFQEVEFVIAET
jgi:hypothetical protein